MDVIEKAGNLSLLTWIGGVDDRHDAASDAEAAYRKIDETLRQAGAAVLQERVFASLAVARDVLSARARAVGLRNPAWALPPTVIDGQPVGRTGLAGIQVIAVRGTTQRAVGFEGEVVGRYVETPDARLLGLADIGRAAPGPTDQDPAVEAGAAIDAAERVLEREGFTFRDVARTWYHLRDILDWYGPFNGARNAAFRRMGLIGPSGDGSVPASTGIAGRNARGGWCALDLIAATAAGGGQFAMRRLHNRKQNEATEYGSAFARGMSLTLGADRYLFVSGTAAIDDHGATVHVGDFDRQATHTIEAIQALLEGAGASLADIAQAVVFLKNPADADRFRQIASRAGIDKVPPVTVVADVCRHDLLVEIEATAAVPADGAGR